AALRVHPADCPGEDVEGGEEGGRAVAFVLVAHAPDCSAVWQLEVALRPFERLDVRLLIDAEDDGVLWWVQVEADDLGRLRRELGVIADAPAASPLELDAVLLQDQPDLVGGDITECLGHEPPVPAREAFRRWFVQYGQDP